MRSRPFYSVILLLASLIAVQGCAIFAVGTVGAVAVKTVNDRRSAGTQLDDTTASSQISYRWGQEQTLKENANIQANVYNGVALITGQAPTQGDITLAERIAQGVPHITKVHNQIRLGTPIDASAQAQDIWISSKVKTQLLASEDVPGIQVKVVVENGEVFLLGKVTPSEATRAVEIARNISGVKRVVRALEVI